MRLLFWVKLVKTHACWHVFLICWKLILCCIVAESLLGTFENYNVWFFSCEITIILLFLIWNIVYLEEKKVFIVVKHVPEILVLGTRCTVEKCVWGKLIKAFLHFIAKFLPHLMIFQSGAHQWCFRTLKNHQIWQIMKKNLVKFALNLFFASESAHSKIIFRIPVPSIVVILTNIFSSFLWVLALLGHLTNFTKKYLF